MTSWLLLRVSNPERRSSRPISTWLTKSANSGTKQRVSARISMWFAEANQRSALYLRARTLIRDPAREGERISLAIGIEAGAIAIGLGLLFVLLQRRR